MSLYGAAPDPLYIRSGGREGTPMGCGATCPMCRTYAAEKSGRRERAATRSGNPERGPERSQKDPRYSWLPP